MSNAAPPARRWPALLWAAVVFVLLVQQALYWRHARPDTDVLALLPGIHHDPLLDAAQTQILQGATQQVVVLIGDADFDRAKSAAAAFLQAVPADVLKPAHDDTAASSALDFYRPHRGALLTDAQRQRLEHADPAQLATRALERLYGPGLAGGLTQWRDDPLGLWPEWWQARLGPGFQSREGWTSVSGEGREWIVLRFATDAKSMRFDGSTRIHQTLEAATAKAQVAQADVRILTAGVPLHAEAAAARARSEINIIGSGSLLASFGLVWLAFGSLRPRLLIWLSLGVGMLAGMAVTTLVFGKVHALTLVFGTSLVGVAEDYGLLHFAIRQRHPDTPLPQLRARLLSSMRLALITSVLGYLALGLAPLPGLRQMAVFSASGLIAAFLTVACWFPVLDRNAPRDRGFARRVGGSLARWPRLHLRRPATAAFALLALVLVVGGIARLRVHDDLRSLQSAPAALLAQEREIGTLLGLPSPAQFYIVGGANDEQVLEREERLRKRLDTLVAARGIGGYRAISEWLPSLARQRADTQLTARVESAVVAQVASGIGENLAFQRPATTPVAVADWLRSPASAPLRPLWLRTSDGRQGSLVMLQGLGAHTDLHRLQSLADGLPGVRWIDRTADISALLGSYRWMMGWLLLGGYTLVALALAWRFDRAAWRTLLPTLLAGLLSLGLLGWLGEPLQLFTMLAQCLLLGVGVDYGIFLVSHHDDPGSWLAVSLGAANTLLSFGLLALSATPALHTFGLTMLFGIGFAWLLSPCFRPTDATRQTAPKDDSLHAH